MIEEILRQNAAWSDRKLAASPGYFARLATRQAPEFFWIGCSDSRVPANTVAGLDPGEVFVHRNVANVVHSSDMNLLSALEFAVDALGIGQIIVCGHYGCGGVRAACEDMPHGLADHWLEPIRRLARANAAELDGCGAGEARLDRLAEINVAEGVRRVAETPILRRAWRAGRAVAIHGLIYGLRDGRLRDLGCTVTGQSGPDHRPAPAPIEIRQPSAGPLKDNRKAQPARPAPGGPATRRQA